MTGFTPRCNSILGSSATGSENKISVKKNTVRIVTPFTSSRSSAISSDNKIFVKRNLLIKSAASPTDSRNKLHLTKQASVKTEGNVFLSRRKKDHKPIKLS